MHNIFFVSLVLAFIVAVRTQWPLESNENDCSTEIDDYKEFWTWTRQQKELFHSKESDGLVNQFLDDMEHEEQILFPPPIIHPIAEKYAHIDGKAVNFNSSKEEENSKSLARKLSGGFRKSFNKITNIFGKNDSNELIENDKVEKYLQLLHHDSKILKSFVIAGGKCIAKVTDTFSGIKQRLSLAVDLIADRFGIDEIVPLKITYNNGTIMKNLAVNWIKIKKLKNNFKNSEEKWKNERESKEHQYVKELLELIKGLMNSEQFELPGTGSSSGQDKKLRRRRKRLSGALTGCILAIVFLSMVIYGLLFIWPGYCWNCASALAPAGGGGAKPAGGNGSKKAGGSQKA